jgi:hypothetical protein
MHGALLGLTGALVLAWGAAEATATEPSRDAELQRCLRSCDDSDSATDRATCRITCEEKVDAKEQPDVIEWHREELKGGSPDPTVERGSTTTTTTTTPKGKTTTVTRDGRPARPATSSRAAPGADSFYSTSLVYAHCQSRCEVHTDLADRAACRLGCTGQELFRRRAVRTPAARPGR